MAFDRVQHETLINDVSEFGVPGSALEWFIATADEMRDFHVASVSPLLAAVAFHNEFEVFSDRSCFYFAPVVSQKSCPNQSSANFLLMTF